MYYTITLHQLISDNKNYILSNCSVSNTVFPAHTEDNNLASVNYCHYGKKLWIALVVRDDDCFVATAQ